MVISGVECRLYKLLEVPRAAVLEDLELGCRLAVIVIEFNIYGEKWIICNYLLSYFACIGIIKLESPSVH